MDYVTYNSKAEYDHFQGLLGDKNYWVGVSDVMTEDTFTNFNNPSTNVKTYINLLDWAPDANNTFEDCVETSVSGSFSFDCSSSLLVACERRKPKIAATSVVRSTAPSPDFDKFVHAFDSGKIAGRLLEKLK